jgi:hypothetical protein
MRAGARERRLRASERPPGGVGGARGELAAKTRPPGRVPGAAVRLLGARASAPVAPDPAAKTGNSRRAGGCGPRPVDNLWHRGIVASVSLRRRCPSWNGEPTVNADGEMSEIAEVELTRHRVVASSADTVRRCFRQILAGWAIATKLCGILGRWTWTEPRFKSLHLL